MSDVTTTEKPVEPTSVVKGMVMYADAGCRPNPGPGGMGIHGYIYTTGQPLKGVGRNFEVSSRGYVAKTASVRLASKDADPREHLDRWDSLAVTPINYIDYYGTVESPATNNACEISAVSRALQHALVEPDVKYLQILTDSEYTKNGSNNWIDNWANNGWVKSDGGEIANAALWMELKKHRDAVVDKGIQVRFDWVRGHNGDPGNEKADMHATIGVFQSQKGVMEESTVRTDADRYWKNFQRHPFLSLPRCYFNSLTDACVPGHYYIGTHGKDNDLGGKRVSDHAFGVVRLSEPDVVIEKIRSIQSAVNNGEDAIFNILLDQIYIPEVANPLLQYGPMVVSAPNSYCAHLFHHYGDTPLTEQFKPAKLMHRTVDLLQELSKLLDTHKEPNDNVVLTDITAAIYDITTKVTKSKKGGDEKVETIVTLRPELVVGTSTLEVSIRHPFSVGEELTDLKLTLGIDIPDRNALKRLEGMNPSVNVVTWGVSEKAFRYATIVVADGCEGIWSGAYSNIRLVA